MSSKLHNDISLNKMCALLRKHRPRYLEQNVIKGPTKISGKWKLNTTDEETKHIFEHPAHVLRTEIFLERFF